MQDRMSEQLIKISSLQSRLDEQRLRAEELHRQGTSDLTLRVHDLHNELTTLKETLSSRDKQIANLNQLLENSKKIIDRQEAELVFSGDNDQTLLDKLETELKQKSDENQKLRDKIKSEMISKVALPDLMETMMAEKNDEIDHLKEKLTKKEKEIESLSLKSNQSEKFVFSKNANEQQSGRVLSTIISMSDFEEPDVLRKAAEPGDLRSLIVQNQLTVSVNNI